jgi:N-acyl-D-aspartate/D-glutamate deacylase
MDERFELVIRGGAVYDGTGAPGRVCDLALRGDRIAAVGGAGMRAAREIDARGLAVAPGFIDVHTHDDFALLLYPDMGFKARQGVTTCVVGNCGMGAAPYPVATLMARAFHPKATLPKWEGYAGYLARLEHEPAAVNGATLVGHGTVRGAVLGNAQRAPDAGELEAMRALVREGIEAGAVGLSTGLIYEPGRYAQTDEIAALAAECAGGRGLYATHMRDEGRRLVEAVDEALEIGRRAGVPVQISHHKASGRANWGLVRESLARIDAARRAGQDVTADQYPYTAGSTVLAAVVQNATPESGGGLGAVVAEAIQICSCPSAPELEGLRLDEAARRLGLEPMAAAQRLLERDGLSVIVAMHSMDEDDVRTVMRHPTTMIGSDGIPSLESKPHPRLYGTFARVLGRYARDARVLSLAEAVHKMTGLAARKFQLTDRGELRAGAFADVVVFDPATVADAATFDDPHRPALGIHHVLVNGSAVVRDGEPTGARPGRPLRRGA